MCTACLPAAVAASARACTACAESHPKRNDIQRGPSRQERHKTRPTAQIAWNQSQTEMGTAHKQEVE
eukprot:2583730-Pleurochrysis_carterae.AAC.1